MEKCICEDEDSFLFPGKGISGNMVECSKCGKRYKRNELGRMI